MERMREKSNSGTRRPGARILLGTLMALLLTFSLGVVGRSGANAGRGGAQARGSETLATSTSIETYESDSVAWSESGAAGGSESDSMIPEAPPNHRELLLQLD
jgi:hypothetical protein